MLSVTVNEGDGAIVLCINQNTLLLRVTVNWLNPRMMVAEEALSDIIVFENIQRNQSGNYMCALTSSVTGRMVSVTLPVVVQCE